MASPTIVCITGAAGALGSALARRLGASGTPLLLLDVPAAADRLSALTRELVASPVECVSDDFASADAWSRALGLCRVRLGAVPTSAALIAGGWAGGGPLYDPFTPDVFDRMMALNAGTAHLALRALLPGMVAAGGGSLVVIGSRAVAEPQSAAGAAAYTAAKAAVVALASAAAVEARPHGIRVNSVLPGTLDTPANRASMPGVDPSRWVSLESLSGVIAFLLSDAARDISGAAIPVFGRG